MTESEKIVQARAQHDSIASFVFTRADIGIRYQRYKTAAHAPLIFQTMARSPWGIPVVNRVVEGTEMQVHASTKSSETAANESSLLCSYPRGYLYCNHWEKKILLCFDLEFS